MECSWVEGTERWAGTKQSRQIFILLRVVIGGMSLRLCSIYHDSSPITPPLRTDAYCTIPVAHARVWSSKSSRVTYALQVLAWLLG